MKNEKKNETHSLIQLHQYAIFFRSLTVLAFYELDYVLLFVTKQTCTNKDIVEIVLIKFTGSIIFFIVEC